MQKYDILKLENQLCFPLYAAAKEVVRLYTPYLSEIGLTYTQYIAMMLIWEKSEISVKELAQRLYLDTGTLTPLLRRLESKGLISQNRDLKDRRSVLVKATNDGIKLREKALEIPVKVGECVPITQQEAQQLFGLLDKILANINNKKDN